MTRPLLAVVLALATSFAWAQSPYAGNWSGTLTFNTAPTCTTSGITSTSHCTVMFPWAGSVDAQGVF